jgi:hypothetical protein
MKTKLLLFAFVLTSKFSYSQLFFNQLSDFKKSKITTLDFKKNQQKLFTNGANHESNIYTQSNISTVASATGTIIGETQYDLISNGSIGRQLIKKSDGGSSFTLSACWNYSPDGNTNFPNRGTGYNHYTAGAWGPQPTARLEAVRVGFPNLSLNSTGGERILTHGSNSKNIYGIKSTAWGAGTWLEQDYDSICVNNTDIEYSIWNKTASSGNYVYVLNNCYNGSTATAPVANYKHPASGVRDPTYFSRSIDGGANFIDDHITLPGYDSTSYYLGSGGESYAIDARDSFVAILLGGIGRDVALWKSTNYGATFTKTILDSFPVRAFKDQVFPDADLDGVVDDANADGVIDNEDAALVNSGSLAVAIDNTNKIHCAWSLTLAINDSVTAPADSTSFGFCVTYPAAVGAIMYWSESAPLLQIVTGLGDYDTCMLDSVYFGSNYFSNVTTVKDAYYGETPITWPSFGFDASNNIYMTYSVVTHDTTDSPLLSALDGQNYRDIYTIYSTSNGTNWSLPVNISKTWQMEESYPCMARLVDGSISILYMEDVEPGNNLTSGDDIGINYMKVINYPIADFIANAASGEALCNEQTSIIDTNPFDASTTLLPNPSNGSFTILSNDNQPINNITIANVLGQRVDFETQKLNANQLKINGSNLAAGLYFVQYQKGNKSFSKKIVIE